MCNITTNTIAVQSSCGGHGHVCLHAPQAVACFTARQPLAMHADFRHPLSACCAPEPVEMRCSADTHSQGYRNLQRNTAGLGHTMKPALHDVVDSIKAELYKQSYNRVAAYVLQTSWPATAAV